MIKKLFILFLILILPIKIFAIERPGFNQDEQLAHLAGVVGVAAGVTAISLYGSEPIAIEVK